MSLPTCDPFRTAGSGSVGWGGAGGGGRAGYGAAWLGRGLGLTIIYQVCGLGELTPSLVLQLPHL